MKKSSQNKKGNQESIKVHAAAFCDSDISSRKQQIYKKKKKKARETQKEISANIVLHIIPHSFK